MPPPPTLRPYLALLPLDDPNEIARELPPDASPLLVRLVHAANPLRSLEQLADETGIAMHMLMSLATHLQAWGKVRLIHPLTEHSILCIHPEFASAVGHPRQIAEGKTQSAGADETPGSQTEEEN